MDHIPFQTYAVYGLLFVVGDVYVGNCTISLLPHFATLHVQLQKFERIQLPFVRMNVEKNC